MFKFFFAVSLYGLAVAGYLNFYEQNPTLAPIAGLIVLAVFVGATIERKNK